jgi:SAM-dependent methyltransferase
MTDYRDGETKEYLWVNLRDLPYFRALLRAVEARTYDGIDLPSPILDLGCGDGHFASIAFDRPLDVGVDPWWGPIKEAHSRKAYTYLAQSDGARLPFPDGYFASAISNSVLEHIPHLDEVLAEVWRVLKPESLFVFCVPNHHFLKTLSFGQVLDMFGFGFLGDRYRAFFNRISRHHNCDSPEIWLARLQDIGFQVDRWWHYFSPNALRILEWGHYFGLPSLLSKILTGRWVISPTPWNLAFTRRLVQKSYDEARKQENGVYTFYLCQRI